MAKRVFADYERFINRHFSWMQFNERVLEEARDAGNPLLERVKFLAITASNLDEFVEVRLAGLMQQAEHGNRELSADGRTPAEALAELTKQIHGFVGAQYRCWREELVPALELESIRVLGLHQLRPQAREHIENFYSQIVEPLLTPVTVDPAHPFPHVLNKALCLAFLLRKIRGGSQTYLGVVTVPRALPRLVRLPSPDGEAEYIFLHDVVHAFADRLYDGYDVLSVAAFRITRNSNLYLEEEESRSILESVDMQLHRRRKGAAVRLEIESTAKSEIIDRLQANFHLSAGLVFRINGPINLCRISHLYDETARSDLKFRPFVPREMPLKPGPPSIFEQVRKRSILLHHPYDFLLHSRTVHRECRAGSRCALDQANPVSYE